MNSIPQLAAQPKHTPSSLLASRPFSLLSTPNRPNLHAISRLPSPQTVTPSASVPSLLASQSQARSFSASASLGVRRSTYVPSRRVQKRRSGFLARSKTTKGRQTLSYRRQKGRKYLSW
ncbi:Ribosomal protein L34 [Penicillium chermesinum]|uniref:Ribosomal protein L34 n=1 Tax=Penicillium chermesinum TaxID=63820 RepID=A0A9W9NYZ8_9EURO|nr:Ribosomal protein L34 [Penicillium chermesinum]KAJ5232353.1 Ribosomal protein L34 [Penicillium chermesinum]